MTQVYGFTRAMIAGCALAAAVLVGADARPLDAAARPFQVHAIARGPYEIYAREYPGSEPALVLMHGFPDDLGLYDRLVPFHTSACGRLRPCGPPRRARALRRAW